MTRRLLMLLALCWLLGPAARARQDDELVVLELRAVSESAPGKIVVDRGSRDGLAIGDMVTFLPRSGGTLRGSVRELSERSAVVDLFDSTASVPPGSRGQARLPASRIAAVVVAAPVVERAAASDPASAGDAAVAEHEEWDNADKNWQPGMPLLAEVGVLRPEQRPVSSVGRIYASGDQVFSNDSGRTSGFYRLGSTAEFSNSFGRGETLSFDAELVYKGVQNPDGENGDDTFLNFYELSYREGGTRFVQQGWEAGRFLQNGMPEFGYLDGFEWGQRLPGGDTWGASVGFMPEPSEDQSTGEDMQFAGYYRWISDSTEQLSATAGYQKSFHSSSSDRDLLVANVNWLPAKGWNFLSSVWVDFYNGGDVQKEDSAEVTLARLSSSRYWADGSRVSFTFNHQAYADLEREELPPPVDPNQITNDSYSSLGAEGAVPWGERTSAHGYVGVWVDQDDNGGNVGAGLTWDDFFAEQDSFDTTLFAASGIYSDVAGARFTWTRFTDRGSWNVFYESSYNHLAGFTDDNDDILQHWLGASSTVTSFYGWSLSLRAETQVWDDFNSWTVGFYTQKLF